MSVRQSPIRNFAAMISRATAKTLDLQRLKGVPERITREFQADNRKS
jgi:hypothetical protein